MPLPPPPKPRESTVEDYLVQRVKALGGAVRKVNWVGVNGAPDRLVLIPGRHDRTHADIVCDLPPMWIPPRSIWVELKRPGGKARHRQEEEHAVLRQYGQAVYVIDSKAAVDALLS